MIRIGRDCSFQYSFPGLMLCFTIQTNWIQFNIIILISFSLPLTIRRKIKVWRYYYCIWSSFQIENNIIYILGYGTVTQPVNQTRGERWCVSRNPNHSAKDVRIMESQTESWSSLIAMNLSTKRVSTVVIQLERGVWGLLSKVLPSLRLRCLGYSEISRPFFSEENERKS